jgi:thiol-disulfide isomerase/thioredoxin
VSRFPRRTAAVAASPRPARLGAAIVAGVLVLSGCAAGQGATAGGTGGSSTNFVAGTVGTTAFKAGQRPAEPQVSGVTLTGQRLSLAALRGSVVVMNFWASWCTPCRGEAPTLGQLYRAYRARGVQFVGVNIKDPGQANGEAFERSFGIGYPSLYDPAGQILLAFRATVFPSAIPSTLVIDRSGHIAARITGQVSYSGLRQLLNEVAG